MRDRLIELIANADSYCQEPLADYLLENGVKYVPPCKINDDLWWIDEFDEIHRQEKAVRGIMFCDDGRWYVLDYDKNFDEVGTRFAYLSKEEAEQALKGGAE